MSELDTSAPETSHEPFRLLIPVFNDWDSLELHLKNLDRVLHARPQMTARAAASPSRLRPLSIVHSTAASSSAPNRLAAPRPLLIERH
jgi:hypothetical protein